MSPFRRRDDIRSMLQTHGQSTSTLADLIRTLPAEYGDRAAFVLPAGGSIRRVSFTELSELADRFAAGLDGANVPRGARVMLLAPPTVDIFAFAVAVLATGRVLVTADGRADVGRIRHALREA